MRDGGTVLVTGATGYIGGRLVPELLAAGYRVRVLARHPERISSRDWSDDVEVVAGDATSRPDLRRALDGVDVAYYLIHALGSGPASRSATAAPPAPSRWPPGRRASVASSTSAVCTPMPNGSRRTWSPAARRRRSCSTAERRRSCCGPR